MLKFGEVFGGSSIAAPPLSGSPALGGGEDEAAVGEVADGKARERTGNQRGDD